MGRPYMTRTRVRGVGAAFLPPAVRGRDESRPYLKGENVQRLRAAFVFLHECFCFFVFV